MGRKPILARRRVRRQGRSVRALRGTRGKGAAAEADAQLHTRRADGPVREHRRVRHWDAHGLQARSAGLCRRHEHCLFPFRRVYRRELPRRIRRQRRFKRCDRTNCAGCAETA